MKNLSDSPLFEPTIRSIGLAFMGHQNVRSIERGKTASGLEGLKITLKDGTAFIVRAVPVDDIQVDEEPPPEVIKPAKRAKKTAE